MEFICYEKCSTCQKAKKWLLENNFDFNIRDIKTNKPSKKEIENWSKLANRDLKKFFNTSGLKYKELNLKDKLKDMSENEILDLLSSDGMLVKRPILVKENIVLVGFKVEEWEILKR